MEINVKNYRGIESASIVVEPVALVAGNNGRGKSSIAQAVASVLVRDPVLPGMLKKDAKDLLREGQSRGSCSVGSAKVSWPGGTVNTDSDSPWSSLVAAGLASPAEMKPAEAAAYLSTVLQAEPTREDLDKALSSLSKSTRDAVWSEVEAQGWDAAHRRAKESGARLKGQWEQVTGEQYGSRKAAEWKPSVFADTGLPDSAAVDASVAKAKADLEALIANAATSDAAINQLQEKIDAGAIAAERMPSAGEEIQTVTDRLHAERQKLQELPQPEATEVTATCPCCSEQVVVVTRQELRRPTGNVDAEENARRQAAIDLQNDAVNELNRQHQQLSAEAVRLHETIKRGDGARAELEKARTDGAKLDDIEAAREKVTDAEYLMMMLSAYETAKKKVAQLEANVLIVEQLAPSGLRQSVLTEVLTEVNGDLTGMAATAGWGAVTIGEDMKICYGGRDYRLLSASEKFRVRTILQLYIAQQDGSSMVVIDAADILDKAGRNGLFKAIRLALIPTLVCMTLDEATDAPNLKKAGIGRSYWIESHAATEI